MSRVPGDQRRRLLVWAARCLWGLVLAALLIHFIPGQGYRSATSEGGLSQLFVTAAVVVFLLAFATVGALVASRVPGNPVGWLLLGSALAYTLATAATGLPTPAPALLPGTSPMPTWPGSFDTGSGGTGERAAGHGHRLAAVGGELQIQSRPGHGTTVTGRLPAAALELVP